MYEQSDTFNCEKCTLKTSITRHCTRKIEARHREDPALKLQIGAMIPVCDPDYARSACWKAQVPDEMYSIIEDARLFQKHGVMWTSGGLGDQPAWWDRLMRFTHAYTSKIEAAKASGSADAFSKAIEQFKVQISKDQARGKL